MSGFLYEIEFRFLLYIMNSWWHFVHLRNVIVRKHYNAQNYLAHHLSLPKMSSIWTSPLLFSAEKGSIYNEFINENSRALNLYI